MPRAALLFASVPVPGCWPQLLHKIPIQLTLVPPSTTSAFHSSLRGWKTKDLFNSVEFTPKPGKGNFLGISLRTGHCPPLLQLFALPVPPECQEPSPGTAPGKSRLGLNIPAMLCAVCRAGKWSLAQNSLAEHSPAWVSTAQPGLAQPSLG